jgi:hypothetical protein
MLRAAAVRAKPASHRSLDREPKKIFKEFTPPRIYKASVICQNFS